MKILYDTHIMAGQRNGGISRYHYELAKGLFEAGHDVHFAGKFIKNKYLLNDQHLRPQFCADPKGLFASFNKWQLLKALRCGDYDIFHPTDAKDYFLDSMPTNKAVVFTIHDMIAEKQSGFIAPEKRALAQRADLILAVSQTTKSDVIKMLDIPSEKILVNFHGSSLTTSMAQRPKMMPPQPYLLYVGDRAGYKNFNTFVKAIADLFLKNSDLRLVCVGRAFTKNEQSFLSELKLFRKTLLYSNIPDAELAYLYSNAQLLVFPSLAEGFGLPILESWSTGVPIALSDIPCFREIAGDAGAFFDPTSVESIAKTLSDVLHNNDLRNDLKRCASERLPVFSWANCCKNVIEAYQSVCK